MLLVCLFRHCTRWQAGLGCSTSFNSARLVALLRTAPATSRVPLNRLMDGLCRSLPVSCVTDPEGSIAGVMFEIALVAPEWFQVGFVCPYRRSISLPNPRPQMKNRTHKQEAGTQLPRQSRALPKSTSRRRCTSCAGGDHCPSGRVIMRFGGGQGCVNASMLSSGISTSL